MTGLAKRISLYFNPPKKGEVFFGSAHDFICDSLTERIFFGLSDRYGMNNWNFIPGTNTYRFTILSDSMPYYICDVEILAAQVGYPYERKWLKRSRERRIWKKDFRRLILEGRMTKTTSQSLFDREALKQTKP